MSSKRTLRIPVLREVEHTLNVHGVSFAFLVVDALGDPKWVNVTVSYMSFSFLPALPNVDRLSLA